MYNSRFWKIVRWIAFIPAAFLGLFAIYAIINYVSYLAYDIDSSSIPLGIMCSFASGIAFMVVGIKVVPEQKKWLHLHCLSL